MVKALTQNVRDQSLNLGHSYFQAYIQDDNWYLITMKTFNELFNCHYQQGALVV